LICCYVLLAALSANLAFSQAVNATLLGTVTDPSGAVVPNAKVTITEVTTNTTRTSQTNESGYYFFAEVPPGSYSVTVEATGFKMETRKDIMVRVETNTRVDIPLQTGSVTETVEVTGAPPELQTDSAATGEKIDRAAVAEMPLISREI
jgi:hypothetical protein